MPIFDVGYRHWEGKLRSPLVRCWTITRTGIALAFRSILLKRFMYVTYMPLLYFAPLFFAIGYVTDPVRNFGSQSTPWFGWASEFLGPELSKVLRTAPESVRPVAWSIAFYYFFSWPQAILTMLVVAIVAPGLIAQDVRSKAFLLYFSKPITRAEYLLGKACTVSFFIAMMMLAPPLILYTVSILFSPSAMAFVQTSYTVVRILGVFLAVAVPMTLISLCLSSMAKDARFPTLGWAIICVGGEVVYWILYSMSGFKDSAWICCASLRKTISVLTQSIYNVPGQLHDLKLDPKVLKFDMQFSSEICLVWLAFVSVLSLSVLYRRISAPIRI